MNPLRLGIFSGLKQLKDEREQRKQMLEDRVLAKEMHDLKRRSLEQEINRPAPAVQWETKETDRGMVQVHPVTGEVRPVRLDDVVLNPRRQPKRTYDSVRGVLVNEDDGTFKPLEGLPGRPQASQAADPLVVVEQPDGKGGTTPVYVPRSQAAGKQAPRAGTSGAAQMSKAVAANRSQIMVIDDAMKELDAHPDAVGLSRGIGEMIPFLGGIQDAVNQRRDPKGVAARAQVANIGSLKMHDRSGANVTIGEMPRMKPFIPSAADTPQAIRVKLQKLRELIEEETRLLSGGMAPTTSQASPPTSAIPSFEEWKAAQRGGAQ